MLSHLNLENFKSWKSADLTFGRITGLFGKNSSGKSSLIQFLLLLKQTRDASDRNVALDLNGPHVELGTMSDVLFRHDGSRGLGFQIGIRSPEPIEITDSSEKRRTRLTSSRDLVVSADVASRDKGPVGDMLRYRLGDATFYLERDSNKRSRFVLRSSGVGGFRFLRAPGRKWDLPGPMKTYQFPDQARAYHQNAGFLADLEVAFEKSLDGLFYLGPLREWPRRDYLWARSAPTDVGQRGERVIDAILAAQDRNWTRNLKPRSKHKKFSEMIAHWLKEMELLDSFDVVEIAPGSNRWQVKVRTQKKGSEVLLTDVGFGVSQVLPVITLLYYVPEGATVILEQPELHLHPLAQAELTDAMVQAALHRNIQVIVESHSEHLLLRLQRRIAEEEISADDVKLYFCDASTGRSVATPLELDLYGNILNWPDKFMGDSFSEVAKAELKRLKRMQRTEA